MDVLLWIAWKVVVEKHSFWKRVVLQHLVITKGKYHGPLEGDADTEKGPLWLRLDVLSGLLTLLDMNLVEEHIG